MFLRDIETHLRDIAKRLPVVAVMGPRQSGKTTLARLIFNKHTYLSFEDLDIREHALRDPRGFLAQYDNPRGIILDEIQNAPEILSYIQTKVDLEQKHGYFILTGSQYFLVNDALTQTLAGRLGIFTLLPLSIHELQQNAILLSTPEEVIVQGSYPRIYHEGVLPSFWYASYIKSYIERDVRQVTSVGDLGIFKTFLRLCAGRIGQPLNVSSLANDCGITQRTANEWLSLLQASFILILLQPHYQNFSKRLVKTPKLYFFDTGVACSLLEIETAQQLQSHYLRGGLFENACIADFFKQVYNAVREPRIYFWRDNHGHEIDCIIERGSRVVPVEIKAGKTVSSDYFSGLRYWLSLSDGNKQGYVIYAGDSPSSRENIMVLDWKSAGSIVGTLDT